MGRVFGDITSPRLLVVKGVLFVVLGALCTLCVALTAMVGVGWSTVAALHVVGVWAWCRAYYFAFYVLEKYVPGGSPYAGLWDAVRRAGVAGGAGGAGRRR